MFKLRAVLTVSAALLISQASHAIGQSCSTGDVRLVGGSGPHEGRVEICRYSYSWSTVCDTSWGSNDAGVVCRQLGFAYEGAIPRYNSYFGRGYGTISYSRFGCSGSESRILDCYYRSPYYYDYCDHYDDAGVVCRPGTTIKSIVERNITTDVITDIKAIRLINGEENINSGRLEVFYNGTWGTVCDDFWSYSDAKVACRMFGYDDAACAVTTNHFGAANRSVPFWMDNMQCSGSEEALDQCSFPGWGIHNCLHGTDDAGVVCVNSSEIGTPYDLRLVDSRTTTLTINFTILELPMIVQGLRFYVQYRPVTRSYSSGQYVYPSSVNNTEVTFTIESLSRDTAYSIRAQVQMRYTYCSNYIYGNFSDPEIFQTNATLRRSTIPTRLVSPYPGVDFLGRVEVYYSGRWGTICDNSFSTPEANLICQALNFTQGALCTVPNARYGRGTGTVWLNYLDCSSGDEVIEDCSHRGWGLSYCSHSEDVGVVCRPNGLPAVKNLTVTGVAHTSITVSWLRHSFPRGTATSYLQLRYQAQGSLSSSIFTLSSTQTQYTLRNLRFDQQYNISIRARMTYSYCYTNIYGEYSNEVSATTMETAPTGSPTSFNLVAINTTAIEAMWELPSANLRNGFIRGYKLFVTSRGMSVVNITIPNNATLGYIVGGLERATPYTFSVLAYTVADGPRSIHLTAITLLHDPLIAGFGVYGNKLDKAIMYTYNNGFEVHCTTSNNPNITSTDWFFANGSKVGIVNSNFREGHYGNKTTVLQIGVGRRLSYCDGGNYTCVVNTTSGRTERRSFRLIIGSSPPTPSRPTIVAVKGNTVTIEWSQAVCDGGHIPQSYTIRYRRSSSYYSYIYIRQITQSRYRITGLSYSTSYQFWVSTATVDSRTSSYSSSITISTLPRAPTAPRDVRVRQVRPLLVEVSWRVPATSYGVITHYTVYAIPQLSYEVTRGKRQATSPPQTIKKVFPSSITSGNVSLIDHSITYQFQVSASINSGGTPNEGELSTISANTTLFIPMPGLPTPVSVNTSRVSNTTAVITWEYPPPPFQPIQSFLVTYSGNVEWRSPGHYLIQFEDTGTVTVTGTTAVVSNLIPSTNYQFKVSAITANGRGSEMSSFALTRASQEERLAFFQLRLKPVFSCLEFMNPNNNMTDRLLKFRSAIVEEFNDQVCSACGLTTANIRNDEFSCRGGLINQIVYRAMVVGTNVYSAPGLVSLVEAWVASGIASITVLSSRLHLDKDCSTPLDTLNDPDCPLEVETTTIMTTTMATTAIPMTTTLKEVKEMTTKPEDPDKQGPNVKPVAGGDVKAGEIGGFLVGAVIAILLAVLIVVIIVIAIRKSKSSKYVPHDRMFDASFHDIGSNKENIQFDSDTKEDAENVDK